MSGNKREDRCSMSTGLVEECLEHLKHSASCFPRTGRDCMRVMPSLAPIWGSLMLNTGTVGFQWDLDLDRSLTFLE